ncbi:hypothetical protein PQ469_20120 [Mucilaginibacter sp. KACC 22773]|uniref:hypothetical protein n=1 Tax=Mucilaginibacter sp. KACC 22773 TaxID=3025671 RepID=UPI00236576FC|nr:hypothetical protein [Mucilaginibacter sp. KACC 22773]WDF76199.1 hypothetical protein PQ469_20120 [Mucilaginibacter sp. KACC 22773]
MNIKIIILTVLVGCISTVGFGQYTYKQKLGNLATVMLPDTPKLQSVNGVNTYVARYKGVIFLTHLADMEGGLRDLLNNTNADSLYNSYLDGLVKDSKGKLFYKNKIDIDGLNGLEFGYRIKIKGRNTYLYQRVVCLNDSLVSCGILASDSLSSKDKNLKAFFDGFRVLNASGARQDVSSNLAYKTGKVIGFFMFLCIPILIGVGIVFLIRRIIYKKNKDR